MPGNGEEGRLADICAIGPVVSLHPKAAGRRVCSAAGAARPENAAAISQNLCAAALVDLSLCRKKYQELTKLVDYRSMRKLLPLELNRTAKTPLAEQIRNGISNAIASGILASGARLPSGRILRPKLGVARGTVRSAYEKLSAARLIVSSRATGTHVADRPSITARLDQPPDRGSFFMEMYQ